MSVMVAIKTHLMAALTTDGTYERMKFKKLLRLVNKQRKKDQDKEITMDGLREKCGDMSDVSITGAWVVWGDTTGAKPQPQSPKKRKSSEQNEQDGAGDDEKEGSAKKKPKTEEKKAVVARKQFDDAGAHKVFVSNLDSSLDWKDVKDGFTESVGPVSNVRLIPGGMAVLDFSSQEDADKAVALDKTEFLGTTLRLKHDGKPYKDRGSSKLQKIGVEPKSDKPKKKKAWGERKPREEGKDQEEKDQDE